jgi:hypothetical protein
MVIAGGVEPDSGRRREAARGSEGRRPRAAVRLGAIPSQGSESAIPSQESGVRSRARGGGARRRRRAATGGGDGARRRAAAAVRFGAIPSQPGAGEAPCVSHRPARVSVGVVGGARGVRDVEVEGTVVGGVAAAAFRAVTGAAPEPRLLLAQRAREAKRREAAGPTGPRSEAAGAGREPGRAPATAPHACGVERRRPPPLWSRRGRPGD